MSEIDDDGAGTEVANRPDESAIATPATLPMSEMQMRLAKENPRDEKRVFQGAIAELEMNPDAAEDQYYSIPYKEKRGEKEITVQVEGLSIQAAMALARRWGNNANGARIADEREDRVIVQGMFFDYETNVLTMRDMSVSKWLKKRDGSMMRLKADRLNMAILAGQSKAVRNAILATVPTYLKDAYFATAKHLVVNPPTKAGQKAETPAERIEKGKAILVKKYGATKDEVDRLIANWIADSDGHLTEDEILHRLLGLKNALKDGQVKIEDVMERPAAKPEAGMPQEKKPEPAKA